MPSDDPHAVEMTVDQNVIEARALTRAFGELKAVDRVSFEVRRGEVFGFLGHNGAGKTTTVRLLNGVLSPSGGEAVVLGLSPMADGAALRARTGVLTETPALDGRLTGREILTFAGRLFGVPESGLGARVETLLAEFELDTRGGDRVATYSKGMRQKLAIARALVHEPELIFLDEPTAGLDPVAQRRIHERVRKLAREGRTVFLSTHNLGEAQQLCDRVAVLEHGALIALGTPAELAGRIAARSTIEFDVGEEAAGEAVRLLADSGVSAELRAPGKILVSAVGRKEVPDLAARLVAGGVPLFAVVPGEPSLEDAYFALLTRDDA
jgi:ABC-2 type transport system ATP-binding protein